MDDIIKHVKSVFEKEFLHQKDRFEIIHLDIKEAKTSNAEYVANPGVYVFWKNNEIVKVGRHLTNSRKRALEHIRDNTRNSTIEMKDLPSSNEESGLILINIKNLNDYHWVAAVEIYLEKKLNPIIKSVRTG